MTAATPSQRSLIGRIGGGTSSNKEALITEKLEIVANEHLRQVFRLPLDPVSKTLGPFPGTLSFADHHRDLGQLDNLRVRATSGLHNGARVLYLSLSYEATSLGGATREGFSGRGSTASQTVYFKDSGGGVLFAWNLGLTFELECGWNHQTQAFFRTIPDATDPNANVDWFDDWEMVEHHVEGIFIDC